MGIYMRVAPVNSILNMQLFPSTIERKEDATQPPEVHITSKLPSNQVDNTGQMVDGQADTLRKITILLLKRDTATMVLCEIKLIYFESDKELAIMRIHRNLRTPYARHAIGYAI